MNRFSTFRTRKNKLVFEEIWKCDQDNTSLPFYFMKMNLSLFNFEEYNNNFKTAWIELSTTSNQEKLKDGPRVIDRSISVDSESFVFSNNKFYVHCKNLRHLPSYLISPFLLYPVIKLLKLLQVLKLFPLMLLEAKSQLRLLTESLEEKSLKIEQLYYSKRTQWTSSLSEKAQQWKGISLLLPLKKIQNHGIMLHIY